MRISDLSSDVCSSDLNARFTSSPVNARAAPGNAPFVPGGTSLPARSIYWPAAVAPGTGISQFITDKAGCAKAGRLVREADTPPAPRPSILTGEGTASVHLSGAPAGQSLVSMGGAKRQEEPKKKTKQTGDVRKQR